MNVAFFADTNVLPGLHAALYSCLAHWNPTTALNIHLFHDRLSARELAQIQQTLALTEKPFQFFPMVFRPEKLKRLKPFHENWMAYGRLLLPELLPDLSRIVYLDCDLIVNLSLDLFPALCPDFSSHALAAVPEEPFQQSFDRDLCARLGLDPSAPYFNSGVLYLNLDLWREQGLGQKCLQFAADHAVHDQTALNCAFYKSFFALPPKFNSLLYPVTGKVSDCGEKIVHFVGSPKPFDFAGKYLNNNSDLFYAVLAETAWREPGFRIFSSTKWRRPFVLRRSYVRTVMQHLGVLNGGGGAPYC